MEKNIFKLDNEQLKAIARSFKEKVEKGLNTENAEIQCIPTFITPKADNINGKSLVLDLGGTNYRVALVDFSKSVPDIHPNNGWKKDMSIMKSLGYTQEELFKELADMITGIKREEEMPIGYCFSYPTESVPGGDAKLLRMTCSLAMSMSWYLREELPALITRIFMYRILSLVNKLIFN